MKSLFVIIGLSHLIVTSNGRRGLLQEDLCCRTAGESQGLLCECRQACTGTDCNSGNKFGIGAACGTGVCCCGNGCVKEAQPELDQCPTQPPITDPTRAPSANPSANPSVNPSANPSANPSSNPSANPSANPSINPSLSPSANPSVSPTVPQCAEWNPESSAPTTNPTGIPAPDTSQSLQLCQLGKSGDWNSLDRWYSWDCSCYDPLTLFKLNQFIHGWFYEIQLNYNEEQEGRFESYFDNYSTDDIFMKTSISSQPQSSGPEWNDLESLTSCDPANPGYPEFTRQVAQTMDFTFIAGGVFFRECAANGDVAYAQLKTDTYRIRDGITENQVVFGDFIVERQQSINIWLFKEIVFTGQTVGFLPQDQP